MSIQGGALWCAVVMALGCMGCGGAGPAPGTQAPPNASPRPSTPGGVLGDSGLSADAGNSASPTPAPAPDSGAPVGADCDGLGVTSSGASASFTTPPEPRGWVCAASAGEGGGNLAFVSENAYQPHQSEVFVVTPDGGLSGTYQGTRLRPIGQASGFEGADVYGAFFQHDVVNLSSTGGLVRRTSTGNGGALQANNPLGGVVLVASLAGAHAGTVESYDEAGTLRWKTALDAGACCLAVGVDRAGNTLVLADGSGSANPGAGALTGVWLDAAGHAQTPFEVLASSPRPAAFELVPQVGSGLFLQETDFAASGTSSRWVASVASLALSAAPAPAWLVARPNTDLRIARGGRGYAALPMPTASAPDCHQDLEVLSAAGSSCSITRLSAGTAACATGALEVGYDGTVLQPLPAGPNACDASGQCVCAWQWFPALLK